MGQPPRHGHGGWGGIPARLGQLPPRNAKIQSSPVAHNQAMGSEERNVGVLRVKEIDDFLTQFPNPSVQHFTRHESVLWNPNLFAGNNVVFQMFEAKVPDNMVWVVTDVQWYIIVPGPGLNSPPRMLNEAGVYGQMYFQILFNNITPLELEGEYANVFGVGNPPIAFGRVNGWPFLRRDIGEECPCFAIYARTGSRVTGQFTTTAFQTFPITAVGTRINGFSLPMNVFSTIWDGGV